MTDIMTADNKLASHSNTKSHRQHRTHRRLSSSSTHKSWISILITILWVILVTGLIILALINSKKIDRLTLTNQQQARELQQLRPQAEQQGMEIAELVQNRLPSLQTVQLDQVIKLKHHYLKNIVFTLTGKFNINRYEFKITGYNKGLAPVRPEFKVVFFSYLGIQLSEARIGMDKDDKPTLEALQTGESRSFSDSIQLSSDDEQPRYFKIISPASRDITFLD